MLCASLLGFFLSGESGLLTVFVMTDALKEIGIQVCFITNLCKCPTNKPTT